MGTLNSEAFRLHLTADQDKTPPSGTVQDIYAPSGILYSNNPTQWFAPIKVNATDSGSGIKYILASTTRPTLVNNYFISMSVNNLEVGDTCVFSLLDDDVLIQTSFLRLKKIVSSSPLQTQTVASGSQSISYTFGSTGEYLCEGKIFTTDATYSYARFFTVTSIGIPSDPGVILDGGITPGTLTINRPSQISAGADVAFLIDTSGSYRDDIATFRAKADDILDEFDSFGNDVRYAITSFCDLDRYAYRMELNLTSNKTTFKSVLNSSNLDATGGGDFPEAQLDGLYGTAADVNWRSGTLRVVFVVTDAPFHDPSPQNSYTESSTITMLNSNDITVYGITSGGTWLSTIPASTGGVEYSLSSDSAEIVERIGDSLVHLSNNTEIVPQPNLFISSYSPSSVMMSSIPVGSTFNFTAYVNTALIASLGYTGSIVSEVVLKNDKGVDMVKIPVIFT